MLTTNDFCLILGGGKTGQSVERWLSKNNIPHIIYDDQIDDGIDHIDFQALTFIIQSPGIPLNHPVSQKAQAENIPIITDLDIFNALYPNHMKIGITGTNGKSTTTALVGHLLKYAGYQVAVGGNIGVAVLDLPQINEQRGIYVLELSSYQLELTHKLDLTIAAWLNISNDHLARHGTMRSYIQAKARIFENAEKAIICIDDNYSKRIGVDANNLNGNLQKIIASTRLESTDIFAKDNFIYSHQEKQMDLSLCSNLAGAHNHQNAVVAFGIGAAMGINPDHISYGMLTYQGLDHRMQVVKRFGKLTIVNDSKATNANAAEQALKTYIDKKIYWLCGGQAKEDGIMPLVDYFEKVHHVFLFGEAQADFARIFASNNIPFTSCDELELATKIAIQYALDEKNITGEKVILLSPACASFDHFKNFEKRGDFFKQIVGDVFVI